ncbi:hypothetical protein Tco_1018841, partial [Tanacetum coccineum]
MGGRRIKISDGLVTDTMSLNAMGGRRMQCSDELETVLSQGKKTTDTPRATIDVFKESDSESARKQTGSRRKRKQQGKSMLLMKEQLAADIMQALKESKKINRRQPNTGGSSEGTGTKLGVPDESTVTPITSSEGTGTKPREDDDDENIECVDTDEEDENNDDDDDKSIDLEKTNDEESNDEFVHSEEHIQGDDKEIDDEFVHGDKQADAEKIEEVKDDIKKDELPPSSSSLSVSLGF